MNCKDCGYQPDIEKTKHCTFFTISGVFLDTDCLRKAIRHRDRHEIATILDALQTAMTPAQKEALDADCSVVPAKEPEPNPYATGVTY